MGEPNQIIPQIIAGILTGGAGATTTLLGVFRKTKERLKALEELVGQDGSEGPLKTGIFLSIQALEETTKKMKREMESWEDNPPKWAERIMGRARQSSSSDLSTQVQFEESIQRSLRSFNERLSRAEDDLETKLRRLVQDVGRQAAEDATGHQFVTREEFLKDSRIRAEEMLKLREQIATVNGLLRGVMSALGIIDPVTGKPSSPSIPIVRPKLPPRPGR